MHIALSHNGEKKMKVILKKIQISCASIDLTFCNVLWFTDTRFNLKFQNNRLSRKWQTLYPAHENSIYKRRDQGKQIIAILEKIHIVCFSIRLIFATCFDLRYQIETKNTVHSQNDRQRMVRTTQVKKDVKT